MRQSMSRVGRCIDNGPMEGFWGILKSEMYYLIKFVSREDLISAIEQYLYFYNNKRYQQRLKCMTPMEFHRAAAWKIHPAQQGEFFTKLFFVFSLSTWQGALQNVIKTGLFTIFFLCRVFCARKNGRSIYPKKFLIFLRFSFHFFRFSVSYIMRDLPHRDNDIGSVKAWTLKLSRFYTAFCGKRKRIFCRFFVCCRITLIWPLRFIMI